MFTPQDLVGSAVKLVTLPDMYIRLQALLDDEDASMADVANLIAHDPGLTARLLRMVNSAFFDFAAKIETVSRAVGLLGSQQIHDLALATSVARAFSAMPSLSPDRLQSIKREADQQLGESISLIARPPEPQLALKSPKRAELCRLLG